MVRDNAERRRGLYRSRDGMIFGVCKGIARYLDISVFWTRVIALTLLFFSCGWVTFIYFVLALLMKPEPVVPLESDSDEEFYNSYANSRRMALHRLKRVFDNLERRVQRMESAVTDREYDWDKRFNAE